MQSVLITGSSSGIGLATLRRLVRGGFHVFASVRRAEDGERLRAEAGDAVEPLLFDVRDVPAVERAAERVRDALCGRPLAGLVNNAGTGDPAPFLHQPLEELRTQIEINLLGTLTVTRIFAPLLVPVQDGGEGGRIVVMSSLGGIVGHPFAAAYCASKHGLEGLAESLRRELWRDGIRVVTVAPGLVATPVWQKVESRDKGRGRFEGTRYGRAFGAVMDRLLAEGGRGLAPEAVADTVWEALTTADPKPRYAPARRPFLEVRLAHALPRRLVDRLIARRLGLRPDGG